MSPDPARRVRRLGVEDVDLGDLAPSHCEDRPRRVRHRPCRATACAVPTRKVEGPHVRSARTDVNAGATVKAGPPSLKCLHSRGQPIVEPVVDDKAAPEVADKTALRRPAFPERLLDIRP